MSKFTIVIKYRETFDQSRVILCVPCSQADQRDNNNHSSCHEYKNKTPIAIYFCEVFYEWNDHVLR